MDKTSETMESVNAVKESPDMIASHVRTRISRCVKEADKYTKDMNEEIKKWKTHSVKHTVAMVLIIDGVSFSYNEKDGIVFLAPETYVERFVDRLMNCYGCSLKPIITEY